MNTQTIFLSLKMINFPLHFLSLKCLIFFLLYDTCTHFVFYIISYVVFDTDMGRFHSIQIQKKMIQFESLKPIRFLIENLNEQ